MKCLLAFVLAAAAGLAADFTTGQAARLVIGQPNFTKQAEGASESLVGGVSGLAYANNMLFVADSNRVGASPINNRVLVYRDLNGMVPDPTAELQYNTECPACVGFASVVLGQPDFTKQDPAIKATQTGLRQPTAVASDGVMLAVADTDNNRVLIWKTIPATNNAPADLVLGQKDFVTSSIPSGNVPTASSMRGPQGLWIQNGRIYVADTQNHRVLIWNRIPSTNGAPADVVLGQPNFTTFVEPNIAQAKVDAKPENMLNPVSVTSDGQHLFVTDLGHNRVLIWNSIPNSNAAPADVVIGQPDMTSSLPNNSFSVDSAGKQSKVLCESNGTDTDGNPTYPDRCEATLSFPRFALSDGKRLYVADGGNDRVLIYDTIPVTNGLAANKIIGQLGGKINQATDAADSLRTPMSLAWDGTNLYVSDAYNRRITVYSVGETVLPYTAVRNAASREIYAVGAVTLTGTIKEGDSLTINIGGKDYKYTFVKDDDFGKVITAFVNLINADAGDPNVIALPNPVTAALNLTARQGGEAGNNITLTVTPSDNAVVTATASGATLAGGQDAAQIAPGTIVTILGSNLADATEAVDPNAKTWPTELGGVQVYFNGVRAPVFFVSPNQVSAQIPYEFLDTTSINAYVRIRHANGGVSVTTPVAVTIVPENPGIFALQGQDPRPAVVTHASSSATGTVSVDGTAKGGDVATVKIRDRVYTYNVVDGDTLESIRDHLIDMINADPEVRAEAAGVFTRIRLKARVEGPEGNGVPYTASANDGGQVILTPTGTTLCCANKAGALVTDDNPAVPGETITVLATGLGLPVPPDPTLVKTGEAFPGGVTGPTEFVSSLAGGKTANVLYAGLQEGTIGVWRVELELNSDIPTNPFTQLTIAQFVYVSNIVTFPLVNPNPPQDTGQ